MIYFIDLRLFTLQYIGNNMHTCKKINLLYKELSCLIRTLRLLGLRKQSAIKLATSVFKLISHFIKTNGVKWTAQRMKTIASMVAGEFSFPSQFIRGLDSSFRCLPPIARSLIRSGKRREVLTALSLYRKLNSGLNPDLSTITEPCVASETFGGVDKELFNIIIKKLIKFPLTRDGKARPHLKYVARRLFVGYKTNFPVLWSSKMGPNGPAMGTFESDLSALFKDDNLKQNVSKAWKYFNYKFPNTMKQVKPANTKVPVFTGRLAVIPGPACKTRIVAICDYFSHIALAPLHGITMKLLATFRFDGTKSHRGIVTRLMKLKGKTFYSLDISAATDRMPVKVQIPVVERILPGFGDIWREICTSRSFKYRNTELKYAVGQPMGLLSSWPVFSLTHHVIALMASAKAFAEEHGSYPKRLRPRHGIVGDDIVLWDYRTKIEYCKLLDNLGVKYKEVTHPEVDSFEMCKRFILKGQDISPVTWELGSTNILTLQGLARQEGIKIPPSRIGQLRWKQHNWKMLAFFPLSYLENHWGITPQQFSLLYQEELAHLVHTWVRKMAKRSPSRFALTGRFRGSDCMNDRINLISTWFRKILKTEYRKSSIEFMKSDYFNEFKSRQLPRDRVFLGFGGVVAVSKTFKSIILERVFTRSRSVLPT
jgi:hypothetical protein